MTLDNWLKQSRLTAREFGRRIGLSEASVSRIRKGRQNTTVAVAAAIRKATRGKVRLA